jgi:outer membrane protein, heavy metal efflux system
LISVRTLLRVLAGTLGGSVALGAAELPASQVDFLRTIADAPALTAASRRTSAARERVESAGRLPDPLVEGMSSRMVGPMDERSTMWEVNLRQPFPKRGERAADRERAHAGVAMAQADYALMAGEMAADTAMALAEAEGAEARIRILETQIGRLDAVLRSVEVRLASGTGGRIADRLTVQTRIATMQLMVEEERRMAADALSDARGRLGLQPETALPPFAAPTAADVRADEAAALRFAAARADEADAMVKMARASANPMTAVGLRFERERRAMGDGSTVGVAFMSEIPWRSRGYARAEVRAAEAERAAAQTDATAARYRISAALTRLSRAEQLADTARRLSAETLNRLNAEFDAMVRAAGAASMGESTVLQTVELLEKATDTELQVIRADTAVSIARAELWRYVPAEQFGER